MPGPARVLAAWLLELAVWGGLVAGFLYLYVYRYAVPGVAGWPHAGLISLVVLAVAIVRLALSWAGAGRSWVRVANAMVLGGALALLAAYYALVLTGLQSWGRVVSWDLITSYSSQLRELMATLGLSVLTLFAAGLGLVLWIAATWLYLRRFDWTERAVRILDRKVLGVMIVAGAGIAATGFYQFLAFPPILQYEPVSLTFYPTPAARDLQGHAIDNLRSARLDLEEDRARAGYMPAPGSHRTNVILIIVDALRPDHLGVYGYARETTPNLARLEREGRLRKAPVTHASCGSSACGLLSLASSKYIHEFSSRPFTLQQALKLHGYRIHMMLSGDHTSYYNLREAYGEVDSYFDGYSGRHYGTYFNDDRIVLDRLANFARADGTPVMIQFHLMSAHLLGKRRPEFTRYLPAASYAFAAGRDADKEGRPGQGNLNFYDNGVLQTDGMIQDILDELRRKGYLDSALVVVTADHGEGLGEHGVFQHASDVYEQTLRVPFLLLSFGLEPGQPIDRRAFVSQVDIAPTILAELRMPLPASWSGVPMQEAAGKPFTFFQERTRVGVIDHRNPQAVWKYWVNSETGSEFAFDLVRDPAEADNALARTEPAMLREWRLKALPGLSVQALPYDAKSFVGTAP